MNDLHFNKSELNIILMAVQKLKNEIYTSKYTFIKELCSISEEYSEEWNRRVKEYNIQIHKIEELENRLQEVLE